MKKYIKMLKFFLKKIKNDSISEYAAECAFFTILAFFPAIIFLVSLLKYVQLDQEILFIVIKEFIPSTTNDLIINIINEVYSKSATTLSVSAFITIWSARKRLFFFMQIF